MSDLPKYDSTAKYYKRFEARRFWEFIKPKSDFEYVEVRLTAIDNIKYYDMKTKTIQVMKKHLIYNIIRRFAEEQNLFVRNNCQFYIQTFEELEKILTFKKGFFCFFTKVCYAVNNRWAKHLNDITGGYDSTLFLQRLFLDVEDNEHETISNDSYLKKILYNYVKDIRDDMMRRYNLNNYIIISSGSGYHLLSNINDISINSDVKNRYKEFIVQLNKRFSNDWFEVDKLYDLTRIAGIPGSYNRKRGEFVEIIEGSATTDCFDFEHVLHNIRFKKKKKSSNKRVDVGLLPSIKNSLEWQVLVHEAPQGERHNILLFALKLLAKAHGIEDMSEYEDAIEDIYGGAKPDLNPYTGTEDKEYNKGIILNWCKRHMDWVMKNKQVLEKYKEYLTQPVEVVNDGSLEENEKVFE